MKVKTAGVLFVLFGALASVGVLTWLNRVPPSEGGLVQEVTRSRSPVRTVTVQPTVLVDTLAVPGQLEARQDVVLSAEVPGKVKKVHKDLGDNCAAGEAIVGLDSEQYQIALVQARAVLKQSQVAASHAQVQMKRQERLRSSQVIASARLDAARQAHEASAAGVEQAEAAVRMAARNLRNTTVRCPFDGQVAQRMVQVGQFVAPQSPLFRLVDGSQLKLTMHLTAGQASKTRIGQAVQVRDPDGPTRACKGRVARLGLAADARSRMFPVEVELLGPADGSPSPDLRIGQVVQTELEQVVHRQVLSVPTSAVFAHEQGQRVAVVDGQVARWQAVQLGPEIRDWVIVASGLNPGQQIVAIGADGLPDGAAVESVGHLEIPRDIPFDHSSVPGALEKTKEQAQP